MGSGGLFSLLRGASRIAQSAPTAARLAAAVARAREGDPDAIAYLRSNGWRDALDVALRPGAGEAAGVALDHAKEAYQIVRHGLRDDVIEGEARELDALPWSDFVRHLRCLSSGAIAIFGARGEGKTTLALKLAFVLAQRNLYPVQCVNFDPGDVPTWAERLSMQQLTAEVKTIGRWLNPEPEPEPDQSGGDLAGLSQEDKRLLLLKYGLENAPPKRRRPPVPVTDADIAAISGRIIVVDEAALAFGQFAPGGKLTARATVINLMMFCRHIDVIVIFVGQMIKQLPRDLRADTIMFYKRPDPEIERQDGTGDDNGYCRQRWGDVKDAFGQIPRSEWYRDEYANLKSWAYVAAGKVGGHSYYGPCPFTPAPPTLEGVDLYVPPEDDEAAA